MSAASDLAVGRVISRWVNLEEGYLPSDPLRSLWALKHPVSPTYEPHGIVRLIGEIRTDALLGHCQVATSLGTGHLVTGGLIQTVQDLCDWVDPC